MADLDLHENSKGKQTVKDMLAKKNDFDIFMHVGDFAYNIQDSNGKLGDQFFDTISPVISSKPYIITAGNHELLDQTRFFNYRFRMPGGNDGLNNSFSGHDSTQQVRNNFYSFDLNGAHWTGINMDWYISVYQNPETRLAVLEWIDNDLRKAFSSKSKYKIVFTHRPIVCGESDHNDCNGLQFYNKPLEDLFMKYKVDLVLQAHIHDYSRLYKIYDYKILGFSNVNDGIYYNGPVYVVSGHSGTGHEYLFKNSDIESVRMNEAYLTGYNPNHMELTIGDEKISGRLYDPVSDAVVDSFVIYPQDGDDPFDFWKGGQWWIFSGAGVLVIVNILTVGFILVRRRKKAMIEMKEKLIMGGNEKNGCGYTFDKKLNQTNLDRMYKNEA